MIRPLKLIIHVNESGWIYLFHERYDGGRRVNTDFLINQLIIY